MSAVAKETEKLYYKKCSQNTNILAKIIKEFYRKILKLTKKIIGQ